MKLTLSSNLGRSGLIAAGVAAVAALAYLNSLPNGFVSDDPHLIFNHPFVQHVADWPKIFTAGHYDGTGGYRPLTTLSFALNYFIAGHNAWTYHLVNILLHALNSGLVVLLLQRFIRFRTAAAVGGLVFALHPVHTEAVAWISGRAELLAALFFFVAWLFHLRSRHVTSFWSRPRILSGVAVLAALFSKEHVLVFPLIVAAGDILLSRRQSHWDSLTGLRPWQRATRLYLPSLIAVAIYFASRGLLYRYSIWRAAGHVHFVDNPLARASTFTRLLTATKIQLDYVWLLIWPRHLCADYSYNSIPLVTHVTDPAVLIAASIGCMLALAAIISFCRNGRLWFGIFFYAIAILPVANVLAPIGTIKAERLLYLPSFALCFVVAIATARLWRIRWVQLPTFKWVRVSTAAAFAVLMLVAFLVSWKRSEVWRNSETLWQSVVAVSPNNFKAQLEVGSEALMAGNRPGAIAAFRRAREIDPSSEDAVINLGAALMQDGQYVEAAKLLEDGVRDHPDRASMHLNLGLAYLGTDRPASGVNEIRRASELEPANPEMRFNLALALSTSGDPESAVREYRAVLELNPKYAEAWNGLGAALFKLGQNDEAKGAFEHALALRPHFPQALYNLRLLEGPR